MPAIDLVIFDCDGVLLDSEIIACEADAAAYRVLGADITWQDISRRFAGVPDADVDAQIAADFSLTLPPDFRERIKARVEARYRSDLKAVPGAADLLAAVRGRSCIASSSAPAKLALGLVECGLYELVYPHIYATALVAKGKPAPDIFLYAAAQRGVVPERCIVLEDSIAGVTAARAAGMRCIGFDGASHITEGHTARLRQAGAECVVSSLAGAQTLILEMMGD